MKNKAAIGCLTVVVLLGAGGAVAGYAAYRKIRSGVDRFASLATVRELDRSVRNNTAYSPPASGELTPAQVEALLRVQAAVRTRLGERVDEMQRKYQPYFDKQEATAADLPALVARPRPPATDQTPYGDGHAAHAVVAALVSNRR